MYDEEFDSLHSMKNNSFQYKFFATTQVLFINCAQQILSDKRGVDLKIRSLILDPWYKRNLIITANNPPFFMLFQLAT